MSGPDVVDPTVRCGITNVSSIGRPPGARRTTVWSPSRLEPHCFAVYGDSGSVVPDDPD